MAMGSGGRILSSRSGNAGFTSESLKDAVGAWQRRRAVGWVGEPVGIWRVGVWARVVVCGSFRLPEFSEKYILDFNSCRLAYSCLLLRGTIVNKTKYC